MPDLALLLRHPICKLAFFMMVPGVTRKIGLASALALLMCVPAAPAFARTFWELEPDRDASVEIGTYTAVGGKTSPEGVFFVLKNNKDTMPVAMTLISSEPSSPLHLSAFKEDTPFLDKETDASGALTIRFRTAEDMKFKVSGPAGAGYQLSVWRGPEIILPGPEPVVSMESVIGTRAVAATDAPTAPTPASTETETKSEDGTGMLIYILLGGILVVLAVIAFLIYRGQRIRRSA